MPGLTTSLWIASQALMVQQAAVNATSNNIANVNTPGYSREVVVLSEAAPSQDGGLTYGNGVNLDQFESVRDQVLNLRIQDATQQQAGAQAQLTALQQVQVTFSDATQGIGAGISGFLNSLSSLSQDPADTALRQGVLTAAGTLANSFHQAAAQLSGAQTSANLQVTQTVNQVNSLATQIAQLNAQIASVTPAGSDPGALGDQKAALVKQLSGLIGVTEIQNAQGDTLVTAQGSPLVVGNESYALSTQTGSGGMQQVVDSQGANITASITGGTLGGLIQARDQIIGGSNGLSAQLNSLAGDLATAFNSQNSQGFDLTPQTGGGYSPGGNIFVPPTGSNDAANFAVDPSLTTDGIAASADSTASGNNGNLASLIAIGDQKQATSGLTPTDTYANLVYQVGTAASQAQAEVTAGDASLQQLNDMQSTESGVSIDEETTNLMRYQQAYQAAARVVTTVDSMTQTLLSMGVTT